MDNYGTDDVQPQANAANYEHKLWRINDLHMNETLQ